MIAAPALQSTFVADRLQLAPGGAWTAANCETLEGLVDAAAPQAAQAKKIAIDMAGVDELDTLGAWLLERLLRGAKRAEADAQFIGLPPRYLGLIDAVRRV